MENSNPILEQLTARVEPLLERLAQHVETERVLQEQVNALVLERDDLKARMLTASTRVNALLERLPPAVQVPQAQEGEAE